MLKTFAYHKPSDDGLSKITKLREAFSALSLSTDADTDSTSIPAAETT